MRPYDTALLEQIAQAGMRVKQAVAEPAGPPAADAADGGITEQQSIQLRAVLSEGQIEQADMRVKQALAEPLGPPAADGADGGITEQQSIQLRAVLSEGQINQDTELALLSHLTGREITTSDDLTEAEAEAVIKRIGELADQAAKSDVPIVEVVVEVLDRSKQDVAPGGAA